jgi:hypothetical protein
VASDVDDDDPSLVGVDLKVSSNDVLGPPRFKVMKDERVDASTKSQKAE